MSTISTTMSRQLSVLKDLDSMIKNAEELGVTIEGMEHLKDHNKSMIAACQEALNLENAVNAREKEIKKEEAAKKKTAEKKKEEVKKEESIVEDDDDLDFLE